MSASSFAVRCSTNLFRASAPALKPVPRLPIMNRARRGLYHGKHIMFGNNVAHSERKSRRTWLPNVQKHKYFSEILDETMDFRLTTHAMRCIDKSGGLDNYLLNTRSTYLGGPGSLGVRLKEKLNLVLDEKKAMEKAAQDLIIEKRRLRFKSKKLARKQKKAAAEAAAAAGEQPAGAVDVAASSIPAASSEAAAATAAV